MVHHQECRECANGTKYIEYFKTLVISFCKTTERQPTLLFQDASPHVSVLQLVTSDNTFNGVTWLRFKE